MNRINRRNFLKRAGLSAAGMAGMAVGLGVGGDDSSKTMTLQRTEPVADGDTLMAEDLNTFDVTITSIAAPETYAWNVKWVEVPA